MAAVPGQVWASVKRKMTIENKDSKIFFMLLKFCVEGILLMVIIFSIIKETDDMLVNWQEA